MPNTKIRDQVKAIFEKSFLPIAVTTLIGALVSGSIGGAWTLLTIATNLPPRVSAVEDSIGKLEAITQSIGNTLATLPNTYITSERYREDIIEIKGSIKDTNDDIKDLVRLHTK